MSTISTDKDTRTGVKLQPARLGRGRGERADEARPLAALTVLAIFIPVALYPSVGLVLAWIIYLYLLRH